jgi:23S rRNA G2445 N2-methylase RlmL
LVVIATGRTLRQIAPYLGRIARAFIADRTNPGDLVVDPFCGCGVVPLEAAPGRRIVAGDWKADCR